MTADDEQPRGLAQLGQDLVRETVDQSAGDGHRLEMRANRVFGGTKNGLGGAMLGGIGGVHDPQGCTDPVCDSGSPAGRPDRGEAAVDSHDDGIGGIGGPVGGRRLAIHAFTLRFPDSSAPGPLGPGFGTIGPATPDFGSE